MTWGLVVAFESVSSRHLGRFLCPSSDPTTMDPPTLESIPPEILTRVAFYLAISPLDTDPSGTTPAAAAVADPSRNAHVAAIVVDASTPTDTTPPSVCPAPLVPPFERLTNNPQYPHLLGKPAPLRTRVRG